jgi:hypothetical protein
MSGEMPDPDPAGNRDRELPGFPIRLGTGNRGPGLVRPWHSAPLQPPAPTPLGPRGSKGGMASTASKHPTSPPTPRAEFP